MAQGRAAPAGLPWAMTIEPLTINNRLIHELLDYILQVLCIPEISKFQNAKVSKFHNFKNTSSEFQKAERGISNEFKIWDHQISKKNMFLENELVFILVCLADFCIN